jgi:UDP:flavonoid glycosyltransferase YjiC (YdhE family)
VLAELDLPQVESALQLFEWADKSFCLSINELENINKPNVYYCGTLKRKSEILESSNATRNKIVIYMGNGTISANDIFKISKEAFSDYEIYIASASLKEGDHGNIHVAPRWSFDELLKEAVVFINHGGQNSVVDGLIYGVPQIVIPGKVFERKFNASLVEDHNAGIVVSYKDCSAHALRSAFDEIISSGDMIANAKKLGDKLTEPGGIDVIIKECV